MAICHLVNEQGLVVSVDAWDIATQGPDTHDIDGQGLEATDGQH